MPTPPFDAYYSPFRKLDRVYWSLVGAGGGSSSAEREAVFSLAEKNENVSGFILDDFFYEPCEGNAADPLPSRRIWVADNGPAFPVTFTARPRSPRRAMPWSWSNRLAHRRLPQQGRGCGSVGQRQDLAGGRMAQWQTGRKPCCD